MTPETWDATLAELPGAHILQTEEWGQLKALVGWKPIFKRWAGTDGQVVAAAMVLQREVPTRGFAARLRILYAPKGPILNWGNAELRKMVLKDLEQLARKQRAIFIKVDPDVIVGTGIPGSGEQQTDPAGEAVSQDFRHQGWQLSGSQVQFKNTFLIDITGDDEALLARMKQKTRYNIRLAQRKGVQTRLGSAQDFDLIYRMYAETSLRDGFTIREKSYYLRTWGAFLEKNFADLLIAEVEGEPVAGLILFRFRDRAWYMYGMSRAIHREKMPTYLLQWAAIQRAKALNCTIYDLWGAPDQFSENDPMWGVYRFKEGLGGKIVRTNGAWDYPVSKPLYHLYNQLLPRLLNIMRKRGEAQTRQSIEAM